MIFIREGSHVHLLLSLLAYTGEYPVQSLRLLGSERTWKTLIQKVTKPQEFCLKEKGKRHRCRMLTVSGKGKYRTIRLHASALVLLEMLEPAAYNYYLEHFDWHHFSGNQYHVERNHRIAETVVMCMNAGIETRPHKLPDPRNPKVRDSENKQPLLFFAPIIDRITYFGAAEYVDPYSSLCELYDTTDISSAVFLTVITSQDVNVQVNSPVKIVYDQSVLGQPYTISFQMLDGTMIGSIRSMRSVCISLLKHHVGASISGTVSSISNGMEYDYTARKHITVKRVRVKLHIAFDKSTNSPFGFADNHAQIKELFDFYSICGHYTEKYFKERLFEPEDTQNLYQNIFEKVQKPEMKGAPIYTLDYRVYEGDAREIDGSAQCIDFTQFSLLNKDEKDLLCYAFGVSQKYGSLKKFCNSKIKYYRYDGKKVFILIRLYTQKDPNSEGSSIKHWHNVRIQIYPNKV